MVTGGGDPKTLEQNNPCLLTPTSAPWSHLTPWSPALPSSPLLTPLSPYPLIPLPLWGNLELRQTQKPCSTCSPIHLALVLLAPLRPFGASNSLGASGSLGSLQYPCYMSGVLFPLLPPPSSPLTNLDC